MYNALFNTVGELVCLVGGVLIGLIILGALLWLAFEICIRSSKQYKYYVRFRRSREYWEYRKQQDARKQGGKNEPRR